MHPCFLFQPMAHYAWCHVGCEVGPIAELLMALCAVEAHIIPHVFGGAQKYGWTFSRP